MVRQNALQSEPACCLTCFEQLLPGSFSLFGVSGRRDKLVKAHKGAITSMQWSTDGETCCDTLCSQRPVVFALEIYVHVSLREHLLSGLLLTSSSLHAGTALLTSGEDAQVKTWSKAGMLRSTLASTENPAYAAAWGPDSNAVVLCSSGDISVVPLQSGLKKLSWQGHDSTILRLDWSIVNDLIVSGGEDCRYKVSLCRTAVA